LCRSWYVPLKAWNDDPLAIQAIKEKIDAQLRATPGE
jgi:hypothetical protein